METFNFLWFSGSCEQPRGTVKGNTQEEVVAEVLSTLNITPQTPITFTRVTTNNGYPGGTLRYEVTGDRMPHQVLMIPINSWAGSPLRKVPEGWDTGVRTYELNTTKEVV